MFSDRLLDLHWILLYGRFNCAENAKRAKKARTTAYADFTIGSKMHSLTGTQVATSHRRFQIGEGGMRKGVSADPTAGACQRHFVLCTAERGRVGNRSWSRFLDASFA